VPVHDARLDVSNSFPLEMRLESFDHLLGEVHGHDLRESRCGADGDGLILATASFLDGTTAAIAQFIMLA
jgi:hypothetical protein